MNGNINYNRASATFVNTDLCFEIRNIFFSKRIPSNKTIIFSISNNLNNILVNSLEKDGKHLLVGIITLLVP